MIPFGDNALMDKFDGTDIQATGRLRGNEEAQGAGQFAGQHYLLLVTAGQCADGGGD